MRRIPALALALLALAALNACKGDKPAEQAPAGQAPAAQEAAQAQEGKMVLGQPAQAAGQPYQAPDFDLPKVGASGNLKLSSLKGKIVLLDFWATWCPPCRAEIPHFVELQKEYGSKGLVVVGVSLDQQGPAVVTPFMERYQINYPIVMEDGSVSPRFGGVRSIPTTFLLGKNGEHLNTWVGYNDKAVFEAAVRGALGL